MIDLHSHILPGIDDGAKTIDVSVKMARMAVDDGVTVIAATPHIMAPLYNNTPEMISRAVKSLRDRLAQEEIPLQLVVGADIHIAADLPEKLKQRAVPTLNGSRYFLFEPPHHVLPPHLERFCAKILDGGHQPVLTHPERMSWIESRYDLVCRLDELGVALQVTAGSITGHFGKRVQYWSERLLDEGRIDFFASDAHDLNHRPPVLSKAAELVEARAGRESFLQLFRDNPLRVLKNDDLAIKVRNIPKGTPSRKSLLAAFGLMQ